ncbi:MULTISPECIES: YqgE/AlgH family protein [unclassified Shimia]|uniref:YqgE/AlgH family protein n=1 Tax=unclassified Shimia TaxID=2630038 RepID=UPI0033413D9E
MDLTGQVLVAMPGMSDPRFAHSVVFLCAHSGDGAMGLIVNKAIDGVNLADLFEQLSITPKHREFRAKLFFGGPVETGRGFVLHSPEYKSDLSNLEVGEAFALTTTQDILDDMAQQQGPLKSLTLLGYSGWGPGQLEREISENGWLVAEATNRLIFETPNDQKWAEALKSIGVDPLTLSAAAGHA